MHQQNSFINKKILDIVYINNHIIDVSIYKNVQIIFYFILLDPITRDNLSVDRRSFLSVNSHAADCLCKNFVVSLIFTLKYEFAKSGLILSLIRVPEKIVFID